MSSGEIGPAVLENKKLTPLGKVWINLNSLHPRMLCVKFGWNWPGGSGGEYFLILSMHFFLFSNYLSLEKSVALPLNKLESPSPKDALSQVWLKLAKRFLRRKWKCKKFTDGRQTKGDQKSSNEREDNDSWLSVQYLLYQNRGINLVFCMGMHIRQSRGDNLVQ